MRNTAILILAAGLSTLHPAVTFAQSVCLPAPRLLTTMPMGAQVGTQVTVTITGENLEQVEELLFSHAGITATAARDQNGQLLENQFVVTVADDCPPGIYEARVMSRLGISSSRVFTVGMLPEVVRTSPNTSRETAMPLPMNVMCNASASRQAVDYYSFKARQDQRIAVDCAAQGIDSKLKPVLIIADADGNDLQVERRGGAIDFRPPKDGTYLIKIHDLTYNGGPPCFYRLALRELKPDSLLTRLPATARVSSFSWPPAGFDPQSVSAEAEPNDGDGDAQQIELPCSISGSFFPAADVDIFEFNALAGEEWWVEVASERLGRPTDPAVVVQHVADGGSITDVAEINDIATPIKVSSNGYSYDGPPYHAGSSDLIGKFTVETDGRHRLRLTDLFGGTRNDPANLYHLVIRRAQPDFAIVGWALHMQLRNGDRNALSKPIALRNGGTMAIEVVAIRRDGFAGEIQLDLKDLPEGVSATGIGIPAGKTRGMLLVTADEAAVKGLSIAHLFGTATIDGKTVVREGRMASMAWPVPDASREIPSPRLLADIPVSVSDAESSSITIAAAEEKLWQATEGDKLTVPLKLTKRAEFSGSTASLKTFGGAFERNAPVSLPLNEDTTSVVLDLARLKVPPGNHTIAFYGPAVVRYQYFPESVDAAQRALQTAKSEAAGAAEQVAALSESAKTTAEQNQSLQEDLQQARKTLRAAEQAVKASENRLKQVTARAKSKDTAEIVVSEPVHIQVLPRQQSNDS